MLNWLPLISGPPSRGKTEGHMLASKGVDEKAPYPVAACKSPITSFLGLKVSHVLPTPPPPLCSSGLHVQTVQQLKEGPLLCMSYSNL